MKKLIIAAILILVSQAQAIDVCNVPTGKTVQYALYNKTTASWVQAAFTATGVTELAAPASDGNSCYAVNVALTAGSKYTAYWKCTDCVPVSYAQEAIDSYQTFVDAAVTAVKSDTAAILEDTGTTIPGTIATVQADLDNPDQYKATGFSTLDAAGVRTAVGLASANLDTQLADLPTVAEFETRTLVAADYVVTSDTIAGVTTVGTTTNLTNLPAITTNWLTAAGVQADAVTKIQTGLATPTNITAGTITTVGDVTNPVTATISDKTGFSLSSSGVDGILDEVVEGTYTMRQLLRIVSSALAGKLSGGGTSTVTFRDIGDTKNRITTTVTTGGNRTSVAIDAD